MADYPVLDKLGNIIIAEPGSTSARDGYPVMNGAGQTIIEGWNASGADEPPGGVLYIDEAPVNLTAPVLSGGTVAGQPFVLTNGTWDNYPNNFVKDIKINGVSKGYPYTPTDADVLGTAQGFVTASNPIGGAPEESSNSYQIGPVKPIMIASVWNSYHTFPFNMNGTKNVGAYIWSHWAARELRTVCMAFDNWWANASGEQTVSAQAYTVLDACIIAPNGTVVQCLFNGSASKAVAVGDAKVTCDEIPVSAFGYVGRAPANIKWKTKYRIKINVAGAQMLFGAKRTGYFPGEGTQCIHYDDTVITLSTTMADGPYTVTGGVTSGTNYGTPDYGVEAIFMGRGVDNQLVIMGQGDSILEGQTEGVQGNYGGGYFQRMLMESDLSKPKYNGIRFAQPSAKYEVSVFGTRQRAYLANVNTYLDEMGQNNVGISSEATILGWTNTVMDAAIAAGVQFRIRTLHAPETSSSDFWKTSGGQTYRPTYGGPGQLRDNLNTSYRAQVGGSRITHIITNDALRDPTDPNKWKGDGVTNNQYTNDGLHYFGLGHPTTAIEGRILLDTLQAALG